MISILAVSLLAVLACSETDRAKVRAYLGDADAQFNLGLMYAEGEGVREDYTEAAKWYRKAADQGNAAAQNNLGVMYRTGRGVPADDSEAMKWYRRAAYQGEPDAQFRLGHMYATGQGVPQDYVTAHKWFNLAAAKGTKDARSQLENLKGLMQKEQIAEAQRLAREWHEAYSNQSEGAP